MSVRVVPYVNGGFEVDIRLRLPNGRRHRERRVVTHASKSAAKRWAENRERHLLLHGPAECQKEVPTVAQFKETFLDYAKTEREKPSTIASKESIVRCHLVPVIGNVRLDAIAHTHVHAVKKALADRKPKTVNNVLVGLKALLRVAIDVGILKAPPCRISMLGVPKREMAFYTEEEFERVVAAADSADARLVVLLGGEAGLRCGEMIALEWTDIDFHTRQLSVARSDWEGEVTDTKGGRVRYDGLTERLAAALKDHRHLRDRACCIARMHADDTEGDGLSGGPCVEARRREQAWRPYSAPHVLFTLGNEERTVEVDSGTRGSRGPEYDDALHAPEPRVARRRDQTVGAGQ
jgi:integrase